MADFCQQCSLENFAHDFGDLAGLVPVSSTAINVVCEGCGPNCLVDNNGRCVGNCLKEHGSVFHVGD